MNNNILAAIQCYNMGYGSMMNVLKAYSLHFALSTNDGKFIAKYYLDTVKIVKNPKAKHLKKYVVYTEFIVKAIKNKNYEMLIDFFEYLCKENVSISHYYLIQSLTIDKLNQNDKIYFDNFVIDLFDRINKKLLLTDEGKVLFNYVKTAIDSIDNGENAL